MTQNSQKHVDANLDLPLLKTFLKFLNNKYLFKNVEGKTRIIHNLKYLLFVNFDSLFRSGEWRQKISQFLMLK